MELMEAVWKPAVARVREEVADMQAIADKEGGEDQDRALGLPLLRGEGPQGEVRPRRERGEALPAAREAPRRHVLGGGRALRLPVHAASTDVPVYHPDVRVWEVTDPPGKHVGLWYFDPYARPGKQSGAWMNAYRNQERFEGDVTTIVSNNSNFVKGKPGEPVLITWDDATTLFHEFGHALHGLSSNVTYPSLVGHDRRARLRRVPVPAPRALALHARGAQPLRAALPDRQAHAARRWSRRSSSAATFNQGFATVEYLASALVDMKLHLAGDQTHRSRRLRAGDAGRARHAARDRHAPPHAAVRPRLLPATATRPATTATSGPTRSPPTPAEASRRRGGPYDKAVAKRLRDHVFSVGNTVDPADGYRAFRGRDPGIEALMRKRGFPVPAESTTGQ